MKIAQFLLFGGFWLVVLDPQKSNRAKNCCTCLQYGKAPSNIDLVPTPEIATIFLKPRNSPRFVLQSVAAITPCVKTSFLLKWLFQNFKYEMELRWTLLPADIFRGQNIEVDKCDRFCPRNFVVWSLDMSRDFPWQLDYTPYCETIYKTIALFLRFFFDTFLRSLGKISIVSGGIYDGISWRLLTYWFWPWNFDCPNLWHVKRPQGNKRDQKGFIDSWLSMLQNQLRSAHTSHMKSRFMSYFFDSWYYCNTVNLTRSNIKYGLLWVLNVILWKRTEMSTTCYSLSHPTKTAVSSDCQIS